MKRINLAGYVMLLFSACLLASAKPASPSDPQPTTAQTAKPSGAKALKKTEYYFNTYNNSGNGCIESIQGIDGFSLSSPLCDGGSAETYFTSHDYFISGYVSCYGYSRITLYGGSSGIIDSKIIYGYDFYSFDVSNNLNEGFQLLLEQYP